MPVRILYILSTLTRCGPVNLLYSIIKHLDRDEFEPHVLTLSPEVRGSLRHQFEALNVRLDSLDMNRTEWWLKGQSRLRQRIEQLDPHIIHTHGFRSDTGVVRTGFNKHCATIHNDPHIDYPLEYGRISGWLLAERHLRIIQSIPHPVAVSKVISEALSKRIGGSVHLIQNGIDVDYYTPAPPEERTRFRHSLGIQDEEIVFVYAGRFIRRKNPEHIVRAFMKVCSTIKAKLLMLGDGELLAQCRNIAGDTVIFAGDVADVRMYLSASDVFVSSSFGEGLPLAVIEAMSMGLPVLLSDIPSHREIFSVGNAFVQLFSLSNLDDLMLLLYRIRSLELSELSIKARDCVLKEFSSNAMVESYQKVYHRLAK